MYENDILQDCLVITLHQKLKLTETPNSDSFFYQNPFLSKKSYDLGKITQYKRLAYILCPVDTCVICKDFCEEKDGDAYWIKAKGFDEQGSMNKGGHVLLAIVWVIIRLYHDVNQFVNVDSILIYMVSRYDVSFHLKLGLR